MGRASCTDVLHPRCVRQIVGATRLPAQDHSRPHEQPEHASGANGSGVDLEGGRTGSAATSAGRAHGQHHRRRVAGRRASLPVPSCFQRVTHQPCHRRQAHSWAAGRMGTGQADSQDVHHRHRPVGHDLAHHGPCDGFRVPPLEHPGQHHRQRRLAPGAHRHCRGPHHRRGGLLCVPPPSDQADHDVPQGNHGRNEAERRRSDAQGHSPPARPADGPQPHDAGRAAGRRHSGEPHPRRRGPEVHRRVRCTQGRGQGGRRHRLENP